MSIPGRAAVLYTYRPQASIRRPAVFLGQILSPRDSTDGLHTPVHIGYQACQRKRQHPSRHLSRAINSFTLGPSIEANTLAGEQEKDELLQNLRHNNEILLQLVKITHPVSHKKIVCDISTDKLRPYIPASLRKDIFGAVHGLSHPGANASIRLMTDRYVWPRMKTDVRKWTKMCVKCQKAKVGRHTHAPPGSFPLPNERFKHIHIDITGPFPTCKGQCYLLTCIDRFSRWFEALPMPDMTAYTTDRTFLAG